MAVLNVINIDVCYEFEVSFFAAVSYVNVVVGIGIGRECQEEGGVAEPVVAAVILVNDLAHVVELLGIFD